MQPDDVIAIAASYDATGRYGAQTPFSDQLNSYMAAGKWLADSLHDSIITVAGPPLRFWQRWELMSSPRDRFISPLTDSHMQREALTADLVVPTFTQNVKVGQPPAIDAEEGNYENHRSNRLSWFSSTHADDRACPVVTVTVLD